MQNFHYMMSALLVLWIGMKSSFAHCTSSKSSLFNESRKVFEKLDSVRIQGQVSDSNETNEVIPFATIQISQNSVILGTTYTDLNGQFITIITSDSLYVGDSLTIMVKMFGYLPLSSDFKIKPIVDSILYLESGVTALESINVIAEPNSTPFIMGGAMMGFATIQRNATSLGRDKYDTKTYTAEEIEKFNLGR